MKKIRILNAVALLVLVLASPFAVSVHAANVHWILDCSSKNTGANPQVYWNLRIGQIADSKDKEAFNYLAKFQKFDHLDVSQVYERLGAICSPNFTGDIYTVKNKSGFFLNFWPNDQHTPGKGPKREGSVSGARKVNDPTGPFETVFWLLANPNVLENGTSVKMSCVSIE